MTCGECGNVTAPGAGFPNHVYCKRFLLHMEKRNDASRCRYFIPKPITNADSIRAMTDEELANEFAKIEGDPYNGATIGFWLDWLREEVADGEQS